ncbi:hypothetical protein BVM70_20745 [Salmonella enterica subsp. enterica serovar Cotham]|nr:hypothetical protein [Salmonella enterica subsp. enterica serovar Cotham]EAB5056236.1 hypothetical protein [Salmonella enterica]EAP1952276.1 hypothetical protein [Salmonella enterica]EAP9861307.1 hypothetical protein [Salmonella enterica]EAQ1062103.1 hypothetical protein [Salmonella enterica]
MKYKYGEIPILALLMVFLFLCYMANINFIYFILLFEHYPNFKLKIFAYIVAIHIAYYGCNGLT